MPAWQDAATTLVLGRQYLRSTSWFTDQPATGATEAGGNSSAVRGCSETEEVRTSKEQNCGLGKCASRTIGTVCPPRCRRPPLPDSADSSDGVGSKLEKQGTPDDVAQVHVKPSKKGAASGSKSQSKEGSSSGSEGSSFISGTLSKAFGRLNPFYKGNSGTSEEAKKKPPPVQPTAGTGLKKPDIPKKPNNIAMLRMSKKRPAPQPKVSKAPDFSDRPLSQGPNDLSGSEHWTQV
ncbi:hypothetical protein MRX96_046206 [Rhipicephalus microplus]